MYNPSLLSMRITLMLYFIIMVFFVTGQNSSALANEYYSIGNYDKAYEMYKEISNYKEHIPIIHDNYIALLYKKAKPQNIEKYIKRVIRTYPLKLRYQVDLIKFYNQTSNLQQKRKVFKQLYKKIYSSEYQLNYLAKIFTQRKLYGFSIKLLKQARHINGQPSSYAFDLASVYYNMGDQRSMVQEYLNYASTHTNSIKYIQNIFQDIFPEEEGLVLLEDILIENIQVSPNNDFLMEFLIWLELQRKDFNAAFLQARALDKRINQHGFKSFEVARLAQQNKAWTEAIQIYSYLVKEYPQSSLYSRVRRLLLESKESMLKDVHPIGDNKVLSLIMEYQQLYDDLGPSTSTLKGLRNQALLYAFQLGEMDKAIDILRSILNTPRLSSDFRSECKLDLGDIYLLSGEHWEASLLYSQVEKQHDQSPTGYEAKFRNAKLHYFLGFFRLAHSHLDVLKNATTKNIANDALKLNLLIKNNTLLDTSNIVMRKFSAIELDVFKNNPAEAYDSLEALVNNHPNHSIVDECLFIMAEIKIKEAEYDKSIEHLDNITLNFPNDVLADDAAFNKAVIVHNHQQNKSYAKKLYGDFIRDFPGSMHSAEARLQYRKLRGDEIN